MNLAEGTKLMLLAPVVKGRKGEHLQLLSELRAQGFVRVQIDGQVLELDDIAPLDKRKKHDISVVVDRFKVRDDIAQRLAESFETALNLADGTAMIHFMDGEQEDLAFSSRFACPVCGYSLSELEPRMFSFNNPAGGLPDLRWLGRSTILRPRQAHQPPGALSGGRRH